MQVDVVTIFPDCLAPLDLSLIGRARRAGRVVPVLPAPAPPHWRIWPIGPFWYSLVSATNSCRVSPPMLERIAFVSEALKLTDQFFVGFATNSYSQPLDTWSSVGRKPVFWLDILVGCVTLKSLKPHALRTF